MNQSIQCRINRLSVFVLALVLFLGGLIPNGLVTEAQAGILPISRTYIQATIDTSSWEILAGVVTWEAGVGGNQAESKRIGETLLSELSSSTHPSEVASKISSSQQKEGGETVNNLVLCFPGKMSFSGWNDNSTSIDTNRAQLVRNCLIYDLNAAFKFVYGDSGVYTPSGDTIDEQVAQFASDMSTFMNAVPSSGTMVNGAQISTPDDDDLKGITFPDAVTGSSDYVKITKNSETRVFQYRMVKGYVNIRNANDKLGLSSINANEDAAYIHWGQLAVEAFVNFSSDEKLKVTAGGVYDSKPGAIEKAVADLCNSVANWIANALGLWNFDELIFNSGIRGTRNYVSGVFPTGWQKTIWAFFFISELAAMAMLLYAIIYSVGKKVMGTIDPVARASAIEQIKYLFIVSIILGVLPMGLPLLMDVSAQITGILHDAMGGLTATQRFKNLATNSGGLGAALTYLLYLGALIYFNVFYVFRALTVALLMILAPIFAAMMALSENKRYLAISWFREFCANLFIQPLQALMLSFILLVPATGRNIESIIMAYVMIPLTNMLRQLFFGSSGSMADAVGQKGQRTGGRALFALGSLGYSMARGGISSGLNTLKGGDTAESGGGTEGSEAGNSKETAATTTTTTATASPTTSRNSAAMMSADPSAEQKIHIDSENDASSTKEAAGVSVNPGTTTSKASSLAVQAKAGMDGGTQINMADNRDSGDLAAASESTAAPAGDTVSSNNTGGGQSAPSASGLPIGRIAGGAVLAAGAVALGTLGGGTDYLGKRFFGLYPGREGGLVTQLSRAIGSKSGQLLHAGESNTQIGEGSGTALPLNEGFNGAEDATQENLGDGAFTNPSTDSVEEDALAPASDGGYTQVMEHEGFYADMNGTSVYARGFADRNPIGTDGTARYNIPQEQLRNAGINSIHKAGQGQSMVRYNMSNMGAVDQNRMEQMINMWENGSTEERAAMQAAGISDIQPVTRVVAGQEKVVGTNVTYNNEAVKRNFGIDTAPASTGGRGFEMTTTGEQAPAMVPDIAAYMSTPQAAVTTGQNRISQLLDGENLFTSQVSMNAGGDIEITSQSPTEFVAIAAMTGVDLSNEIPTEKGYKVTIPQQGFIQAFAPESTSSTEPVRAAAYQRITPSFPVDQRPDGFQTQSSHITAGTQQRAVQRIQATRPAIAQLPKSMNDPTQLNQEGEQINHGVKTIPTHTIQTSPFQAKSPNHAG